MNPILAFFMGFTSGCLTLLLAVIGLIIWICIRAAKDALEPPEIDSSFPNVGGTTDEDL